MQHATLAVPKHPRELDDLLLAGHQQLLAGEFRGGAQIARGVIAGRRRKRGPGRMKVGFVARRHLQNAGFDLDKPLCVEPCPQGLVTALRACRNGRRSACRAGAHQGEIRFHPSSAIDRNRP